ncbi:MAG TPA: sugar phosphate isomerase/epimerase family protein [Abditibacteriaceae bacterium]|nr:sugar phosphate isomerase/epimerase family protein [Abditibacteriaceae bacterium]
MKLGICCGPGSFAPQAAADPLASLPRLVEILQEAGADYIEFPVGAVMPEGGEAEFEKLRATLESMPLRVEAFNSFIPATHRITGPDVDVPRVLEYCRTALGRCKALGGAVVVLGSAGARKVPDGFAKNTAEQQFVEFCGALEPVAAEAGVTITVEPLNSKEDNLILSVEHGARLVDSIAQPHIQLLADLYHMIEEAEPVANVAAAGSRLRHTHVADLGRAAPGYAEHGEADFTGFFRSLRQAGYDRLDAPRCSFEGRFDDLAAQAGPLLALLRRRWAESAL